MKRLWSKTEIEGVAKESSKQLYRHNIIVKGSWGAGEKFVCRCTIIDDQAVGYTTQTKLCEKLMETGEIEASGGTTSSSTTYPIIGIKATNKTTLYINHAYSGAESTVPGSSLTIVDVVKAI